MAVDIEQLKTLRKETDAGVADCRKALEDAQGDYEKAKKLLQERGLEKAKKKQDRETAEGIVDAYIHSNGKIGVLVEVKCETDFVARNEKFRDLSHEVAMQVAAMNPTTVEDLLNSAYIRDPKLTIEQLVKQVIATLGENITIMRFQRMELGVQ